MKTIKYASLFAGIGGFELGIQAASEQTRIKTKCVFASEFDPDSKTKDINKQPARIIYNRNFGEYPHGDITKIDASDVPDHDILVAGVPCQSWSIAGKRCGFEDIRGTMWYEVFRILKEKKPKIALLENVKGLLSHDGGKSFELICKELNKLGYIVNVEVYNTKHFGIPQNRERVFLTCTHIHEIVNIGHQTKMTISETTIQEYLFQIWLNNSNAVAKQQDRESKDLVLGWLLLCELIRALGQKMRFGFSLKTKRYLSKNYPNLFQAEDILQSTLNSNDWVSSEKRSKAIILTAMDEKLYTSATESVWQSIDMLLQKVWEENYLGKSKYTTSIAIKQITDWKTFTYSQLVLSISTLIGRLRSSSKRSWNEILSGLIVMQEGTNYARINAIDEKRVISESGNNYDGAIIRMAKADSFLVGHLAGSKRSGSKIFPIGESTCRINERAEQTTVNTITAGGHSGGHHSSMTLLCDSAHGFGKKIRDDQNTVPTLRANDGAASNNVIVHSTLPRSSKSGKGGTGHLSKTDGSTYCLDANNNLAVEMYGKVRRLTPIEAERLMGFPDNFTAGVADTNRYRCIGNSATVPVVADIVQKILKTMV